nr:metallo-beta-lactamase family protein [uncultured bacterium]BAH89941.1 metallo-beta-lactamase family protein [uncultured bacterium]BAH90351.1 metallo-beta-lactamase family protein [uncultured bacterium]
MSAPMTNRQNAGWYRFRLGAFEGTIVWDGYISHGYDGVYPDADPAEFERLKTENNLPRDAFTMELNTAVVNMGDKLVVVDPGMGREITWFGENMGLVLENYAAAGIDPADVDAVLITHMHPDHIGGLINPDGSAVFPNAELYCCDADWEEWTNEDNLKLNSFRGPWTEVALKSVAPYRDRVNIFKAGDELFPGVATFSIAGHSAGQTAFIFESEGEKIAFTGDVAHHHVFDPAHPEWIFNATYDTDAELGAKAKADIFRKVVAENIRFHGYHFPYPGIGTIADNGDGSYRFVGEGVVPRL